MKKIIASLIAAGSIVLLCGISNTYAEKDMGFIDLNFCDGTNHLSVIMGSGEQLSTGSYDICMKFKNDGNETMTIAVDIVEGSVAYGETATQACKTAADGYFGKNTLLSGADNRITIAPHETVEKHATFIPPQDFAGIVHGCVTYRLVSETPEEDGMLSIISRKANLIDITVPGEAKSNFHLVPIESVPGNAGAIFNQYGRSVMNTDEMKVHYSRKENVITVIAGIKNEGYIGENYIVQGTVSSLFGLMKREFVGPEAQLYADSATVNQHYMKVPRYQGLVKVTWQIDHRPEELLGQQADWQHITKSFYVFVMPRRVLIIIAGLVLLWMIYRHWGRKRIRTIRSIKITVQKE